MYHQIYHQIYHQNYHHQNLTTQITTKIESPETTRKVWITSSEKLSRIFDLLPANHGRQSLVSSLIKAYKLDQFCQEIVSVKRARREELETFHTKGFVDVILKERTELDSSHINAVEIREILKAIDFRDARNHGKSDEKNCQDFHGLEIREDEEVDDSSIEMSNDESFGSVNGKVVLGHNQIAAFDSDDDRLINDSCETEEEIETFELLESYGLLHDCYIFPFMGEYVRLTAGSSIESAKKLVAQHIHGGDEQNIVINWYGGRHHCGKGRAAGFCYVNDVVLAINTLRKRFRKVIYIDLDLHHGDGVEAAFPFSERVTTCSVHRYDLGFYPGTGSLASCCKGKINIPVKKGLSDQSLKRIIDTIIAPLLQKNWFDCVVIQAGCDGLAVDTHKEWNLTIEGLAEAVNSIINLAAPLSVMILGGGGYNHKEVAKCWTFITKVVVTCDFANIWDILPEHQFLDEYVDDGYHFWTPENSKPSRMVDENDEAYIEKVRSFIFENCM